MGVCAPKISKQLKDQGFKFEITEVVIFQARLHAFSVLRMGGLLTDSQSKIISDKLFKQILAHVNKQNPQP